MQSCSGLFIIVQMTTLAQEILTQEIAHALDAIRTEMWEAVTLPTLSSLLLVQQRQWRKMQQDSWFDAADQPTQIEQLLRDVLHAYGRDQHVHANAIEAYYFKQLSIAKTRKQLLMTESHATVRRLVVEQGAAAIAQVMLRMERQLRQQTITLTLRQLPPLAYPPLHGRADDEQLIFERLADLDRYWLVSLSGLGGCGKTVLAHHVVQQLVRELRFLHVVWLDLSELFANQVVDRVDLLFAALLRRMGDQLGIKTSSLATLEVHLQRVLTQVPILVVIDGLDNPADLLPLYGRLFQFIQPSKLLLIGRIHPPREPHLFVHPLKPLAEAAATELLLELGKLAGVRDLADADADTLARFYTHVGGHPQAIQLVVKLVGYHGIAEVLSQFHHAAIPDIAALYQHIYARLWQLLTPASRQLFLMLFLVADSGSRADYLAHISGNDAPIFWGALAQLLDLALVERRVISAEFTAPSHYAIHPLTRSYLHTLHPVPSLHEVIQRACAYWREQVTSADLFDTASPNLARLSAVACAEPATWEVCATLMADLYPFAHHSQEWVAWIQSLATACHHAPVDHPLRQKLLCQLGNLYRLAGFLPQALTHHHAALTQAETQSDIAGISRAAYYLAIDYRQSRDYTRAMQYGEMAHDVVVELNRPPEFHALAINTLGMIAHFQTQFEQACLLFAQSWPFAATASATTRALILNNWGNALWQCGNVVESAEKLNQAWHLAQTTDARETVDTVLTSLFGFLVQTKEWESAESLLPDVQQRAHAGVTDLRNRIRLLGTLGAYHLAHGALAEAEKLLLDALRRAEAAQLPQLTVEPYALLARLAQQRNAPQQAAEWWQQARQAAADDWTQHLLQYHLAQT